MPRVTIAVPQASVADANQYLRCIGYSAADEKTFGPAVYRDASANLYSVASGLVDPNFTTKALATLTQPPWNCNLTAANRARLKVRQNQAVTPATIVFIIGNNIAAALVTMGITRMVQQA